VRLLVNPRVDNLSFFRLHTSNLFRSQVRDIPSVLPVLRGHLMSTICSKPIPILSSISGWGSGVLLASLGACIMRNRWGSFSWLRGLSYSKRFHLFPTQPQVVKSTPKFRARVQTVLSDLKAVSNRLVQTEYLSLPCFRWFF